MAQLPELDLQVLEADLRKLETEYTMFFAGRLAKPPLEARRRVDAIVQRYQRAQIPSHVQRYRFSTLQFRYATLTRLWERAMRAREEGRPGPFFVPPRPGDALAPPEPPKDRIVHVTTLTDPSIQIDKVDELYARLAEARREVGQPLLPFDEFEALVDERLKQVGTLGGREVAVRVAIKDGQVELMARLLTDTTEGTPE